MKLKCMIALATAATISTYSTELHAQDSTNKIKDNNVYVNIGVGGENLSLTGGNKTDLGFFGSLGIGYAFTQSHVRLEGELTGQTADYKNTSYAQGSFQAIGLGLQAYYDIKTKSSITPYLGGGLAVMGTGTKYKDNNKYGGGNEIIAPDLEIGLNYSLNRNIDIGISGRVIYMPIYDGSNSATASIIKTNLIYKF